MGDFLSHGGSRCPFYHAAQCGTDSWVTLGKKSLLCLQKITLCSPSQTGSCDHYVRGKLNFFLPLFLAWESNGCLAFFLPFLPPVMCAFPTLCCKGINSTYRRDNEQQKEETTCTAMAEIISVISMQRVSCLTSFSSKKAWQWSTVGVLYNQMGTYHIECVKKVTYFLLVDVKSNISQ